MAARKLRPKHSDEVRCTRAYAARLALKKLRTIKHLASKVEIPAALIDLVEKTDYRKLYEVAYG